MKKEYLISEEHDRTWSVMICEDDVIKTRRSYWEIDELMKDAFRWYRNNKLGRVAILLLGKTEPLDLA